MKSFNSLVFLLLSSPLSITASRTHYPPPNKKDAILLSDVRALTLYSDRQTNARRVPSIPQLSCIGSPKRVCNLYAIDRLRCVNQGADYDEQDIQWSCSASLPKEFKLGGTDITCEGYRGAEDPWVLKGSCGVEYQLVLTEEGEERFGDVLKSRGMGFGERSSSIWENLAAYLIVGSAVLWIVLGLGGCIGGGRDAGPRRGGGWGGWGGWGGGGGGGGGGHPPFDDPPPPYEPRPKSSAPGNAGFNPGFWSGALGGAAAGYALGQRNRQRREETMWSSSQAGPSRPSRSMGGSGFEASQMRESTGFGGTRRR